MKRLTGLLTAVILAVSACGGSPPVDESAGGVGEAIAVHGNWTIDVSNADGSLDQHVEFQNAFTGAQFVAEVLAGEKQSAGLTLQFEASSPELNVCASPSDPDIRSACNALTGFDAGETRSEADPGGYELVVVVSFTAAFTGDIARVEALGIHPDLSGGPFSEKDLDAPVAVAAGQVVQVEVRYSFG